MERGSLGFMLQGVSQQHARVQPEGHVKGSVNLWPDPVSGLTSRPQGSLLYSGASVPANSRATTVLLKGEPVRIGYGPGYLALTGYDGTEYTVLDPDTSLPYIGTDMVFFSVNDEVVCLNRETVVVSNTPVEAAIISWGYFYALGGEFSRTYKVTITYTIDGTIAIATYTTPDGSSPGDADKTAADYIVAQLRVSLLAHPNYKITTQVGVTGEVAYLSDPTTTFSITSADGSAASILKSGFAMAKTFADVPRYAREGSVIKVTGETGTVTDDVWLRFNADNTTLVGDGFGNAGVWEEWYDPFDTAGFIPSTMPHILTPHATLANTYELLQGAWFNRRVGGSLTNPLPSFAGKAIKDVGEMQGRLWFLAGGFFCASRTDDQRDFFRKTNTVVLATDPIDIKNTNDEDVSLEYGIPYDKNLLLFAKNGQSVITGGSSITPTNASMSKTSNYEMSTGCRPTLAGSTIMLPFESRVYAGINEMLPSTDLESNAVESITTVVPKYLSGKVLELTSSANARVLAVRTDSADHKIYLYNFMWEGSTKVQGAWHEWVMRDPVDHVYIRGGSLFAWTRTAAGIRLCDHRLDRPALPGLEFHPSVDYSQIVSGYTVTLDRDDYAFIGVTDGADYQAGRRVTPEDIVELGPNSFEYTLPPGAGETHLAGVVFETELRPPQPIYKNWRGVIDIAATVIVAKYMVDYVDSGAIAAYMDNRYRGGIAFVLDNNTFPTDNDPDDNYGVAVRSSGSFEIPWNEDGTIGQLVLRSNDIQPTSYVEARWYGHVYKGKK